MGRRQLATACVGTALLLALHGCGSPTKVESTPARKVDQTTTFEQLQDVLLANVRGSAAMSSKDGWLPLMVKTPETASSARDIAVQDFASWCQFQGGRRFQLNSPDLPEQVDAARKVTDRLTTLTGLGIANLAEWCVIGQDAYLLEARRVSLGMRGYPASIAFDGHTVLWISPQLRAEKLAATEVAPARGVAKAADERKEREAVARAADAARALVNARKTAVLRDSGKGAQLVCSGRQVVGSTLSDIWYRCNGTDFDVVTFAEFSRSGWRVASHTLTPVLLTSGATEHDVTVIFEKAR